MHELSVAQRGLWFLDRLMPASALYAGTWRFDIRGTLDVAAFRAAVDDLIARHEALRTRFGVHEGRPVQLVRHACDALLAVDDIRSEPEDRRAATVDRIVAEDSQVGFELQSAPLFRIRLVRTDDDLHVAIVTTSHIVIDGISCDILLNELFQAYENRVGDAPVPMPAPCQFGEFVSWQHERLAGLAGERMLAYWRRALADAPSILELPTGRLRPATQDFAGGRHAFRIDAALVDGMTRLVATQRASLFMGYLAVVALLLSRYTGRDDICIGTPVANRPRREHAGMIGFCTNMVVVRVDCSGDPTFRELLHRVRNVCLDAYEHQEMPFDKLVDAVAPERSLAHNPLFQVACALGDESNVAPLAGSIAFSEVETAPTGLARFDLSLPAVLRDGEISVIADYSTAVLDGNAANRLAEHFKMLWTEAIQRPDFAVSRLAMLRPDETTQEPVTVKDDISVAEIVARHAETSPEATAFSRSATTLTYRQLAEAGALDDVGGDLTAAMASSAAAHAELGIVPGDRVAILGMPGSARFRTEIIGALAAGAECCLAGSDLLADPVAAAQFLHDQKISVAWLPRRLLSAMTLSDQLRLVFTDADYVGGCGSAEVVPILATSQLGPVAVGLAKSPAPDAAGPPGMATLPGFQALVLNRNGLLLPMGLIGELHVAATRSVGGAAAELLPTGWLARWGDDGLLELHGKAAERVQVGSVAVNPVAVEQVLLTQPQVGAAYVTAQDDFGPSRLAAFVVASPDSPGVDVRELQAALSEALAQHMVPSVVVPVAQLPLTGEGEVDRNALPMPSRNAGAAFAPPRNAVERLVVSTWCELFARDRIGVDDNFFDLGGHSLLAVRLLGHVGELFGTQLPVSVLFGVSTPAGLAGRLVEVLGGEVQANALATSIEQILLLSEEEVQQLAGEAR